MSIYRNLNQQELEALRSEFVQFLGLQGIPGELWRQWQQQGSPDIARCISQFSHLVWERILAGLSLLERIEGQSLHLVRFGAQEALLLGLEFPAAHRAEDLTQDDPLPGNIRAFHFIKSYEKSRNEELYFLLEQGYSPSSRDDLYTRLAEQLNQDLPT